MRCSKDKTFIEGGTVCINLVGKGNNSYRSELGMSGKGYNSHRSALDMLAREIIQLDLP
jgi:hypothetical protein